MTTQHYDYWKRRYEATPPVRGTEIRPISRRSDKHRQIVKVALPDDKYAYALRLYNTDCITYYENGDIAVKDEGHISNSTANFISSYMPVGIYCTKARNNLWVYGQLIKDGKKYPLSSKPIVLRAPPVGKIGGYSPVEQVLLERKVVDRSVAKQNRLTIKPFMDWLQLMLKLSDGWIRHDTMKTFFPLSNRNNYYYANWVYTYTAPPNSPRSAEIGAEQPLIRSMVPVYPAVWKIPRNAEEILDFFSNLHEDDYSYGMCLLFQLTRSMHNISTSTVAENIENCKFFDVRVQYKEFQRCMDNLVRAISRKEVVVEASDKFLNRIS